MATSVFTPSSLFSLGASAFLGYVVIKVLYNLFLHPLRSFPGPLSGRAAQISYQRQLLRGSSHLQLQELHRKYGPVVRYAPNELSFIEPQAWKDIYGHKASAFVKDIKIFYGPEEYGDAPGLIRANDADHARQRRLVSHAFSDKAMKEQEQLLKGHIGILIERLRDIAAGKNDGKTDMVEWYNFTTFDIMSDLTFGESLGQLSSSTYNPWVESVFGFVKLVSVTRVCREYPGVTPLLEKLLPADLMAKKDAHINFSTERVNERMARKTDRPDIWTFVNRYSEIEGQSLAPSELHSNGGLFMLAGTETTATQLSGLTYLLLKNPEKLARLTNEVRSAFTSLVDLTMTKLAQLPYLQACIDEGLRLYPPVPFGLARIAPKEGANVCSRWVPGSTIVQCSTWVASHSPLNFKDPDAFAPERFLPEGAETYASDRKDAMNPFSYGPRGCLGKNLAMHEMRLILASVLLHFELELVDETEDWMAQETYVVWAKIPLHIKLKAVRK